MKISYIGNCIIIQLAPGYSFDGNEYNVIPSDQFK